MQIVINKMVRRRLKRSRLKSLKANVNRIFDWALLQDKIPRYLRSPARGMRLPKLEHKKQPILNRQQIIKLLTEAKRMEHPYFYLWVVAINTGCRSGELYALQWQDVDFDRKMITIGKSYSSRLKIISSTKTDEWREVPINMGLEQTLKELKLLTGLSGFVLPRIASWKRGEAAQETRSFCSLIGVPELTFHSTRACFTVQCLEAGLPATTVMQLGGWKSLKSMQHYVRLAGTDIKGSTDKLNLMPIETRNAAVLSLNN